MRLSKIKLSGFKSFVDPTTVIMPSNLIGVVGPNGCGKSNIIDAVRWVMGETSAKMLRGASMVDVIFSGSASRKPVSLATVELLFDNSDGQIKGEYANYNEISVKRQVNRDAQSFYFLNGNKCRKKDITDLFLGTGLGPRSYSIIEQGMISKIVDSKPEELRSYIEEAAGISKYRERRRETERRILRTRENLERLDDLRTEVGKHIQHLQRQAKNAEKYTKLKNQFKLEKADMLALRWLHWQQKAVATNKLVAMQKTELEKARSGQTDGEKNIELQRQKHQQQVDESNSTQELLYQINAEIGKIEQAITHAQSMSERHKKELEATDAGIAQTELQIKNDEKELVESKTALTQTEPLLTRMQSDLDKVQKISTDGESKLEQWRISSDELNHQLAEQNRIAEVQRTKIASLDNQLLRQSERLQAVENKQPDLQVEPLQSSKEGLEKDLLQQQKKHQSFEEGLLTEKQQKQLLQEKNNLIRQKLNESQQSLHQLKGRRGSLLALQQAEQDTDNNEIKTWISNNPRLQNRRLSELLDVESGWESAVEMALQNRLQAFVSDDKKLINSLDNWAFGQVTSVRSISGQISPKSGTLSECVKAPDVVYEWFNQIKVCQTLQQAENLQSSLSEGESIITQQGQLLGKNWLHINQGKSKQGFLLRQKELKSLQKQLDKLEQTIVKLNENLVESKTRRVHLDGKIEQLQLDVNMSHRKLSEINNQLNHKKQQIEHIKDENIRLASETEQIKEQLLGDKEQIKDARKVLENALNQLADLDKSKSGLLKQQQILLTDKQKNKGQLAELSQQYYQQKMQVQSHQNKIQSRQQSLERLLQNKSSYVISKDKLMQQMSQDMNPIASRQQQLEKLITQRISTGKIRDQKRLAVAKSLDTLQQMEKLRHSHQQQIETVRTNLESSNLQCQSNHMKANGFSDQLQELGFDAEQLAEKLAKKEDLSQAADFVVEQKELKLEKLQKSIVRLEPVNLAAIDEFDEESKRKAYLDEQNQDLESALTTLENAIAKIDRETRTLFKETFEAVNSNIKQLFPKLFGGGHAYLELTGSDLLTTGVAIMARPPGKRVSNIQLLSGGEKALTAVSMVFAIFNLNPAPFCLLDEVDAPLDDANVNRFTTMVKEMSKKVQFLFVTHNKITMEIANQLMGVTMREAGVSRLVSVDLAEAEKMAID